MTTHSNRTRGQHRSQIGAMILVPSLLLLSLSLLGGCEINKPEMPTFDTSVSLPLGTERIEIAELIDDEDFLVVSQDGSLGFSIDGDPDTMAFDFELSAEISGQTIEQGLGNFELPAGAPMAYGFTLGDIWAPAAGATGLLTIVPAFPIAVVSGGQDLPDIESATLASGTLSVTLTNGLPVPASADSGPDQIVLTLENAVGGAVLATLVFDAIAPGGQATETADLAGVTLPDALSVRLLGGSPGSSGAFVTVNGSDEIGVDAEFIDLVVSSANAVVGAQTFETTFDTELPADYGITEAVISSGAVNLDLTNDMAIPCTAILTWDTLLDDLGQPLIATFNLGANQTLSQSIDFGGRLLDSGGDPLTALTAAVDITTPGSSGVPVTMSSGDGLTADLSGGAIEFSSVTGLIPAYDLELEPVEADIDLPDEMDGLELTAATMTLNLTNTSGVSGDVDLTLTGISSSGSIRTLDVQREILPSLDRAPTTTTIILDQTNSTIVNFLNNLPEQISLDGEVNVGGFGVMGTVRADDHAIVSWDIEAPVEVIINDSTIKGDPEDLGLDEDLRDKISEHALGARVQTEILNHLPMGVELRILASRDTLTIESAPELVIGPLSVLSAQVDPITHTVSDAVISRPSIDLTEEDARIFAREGIYTIFEVTLPSTEGLPVRIMSTDYLEVRGMVTMDIEVNDEW